jgi:hypothetical protein
LLQYVSKRTTEMQKNSLKTSMMLAVKVVKSIFCMIRKLIFCLNENITIKGALSTVFLQRL